MSDYEKTAAAIARLDESELTPCGCNGTRGCAIVDIQAEIQALKQRVANLEDPFDGENVGPSKPHPYVPINP